MSNQAAATATPAPFGSLSRHIHQVVRGMLNGSVVPLLGAGVNRVGRTPGFRYSGPNSQHLPDGKELADFLRRWFKYDEELEKIDDLIRVAQYVDVMEGSGELYEALHNVFNDDHPPGIVQKLLAEIQPMLRKCGKRSQVILTTNYDDTLERAFRAVGEPYDLIVYENPKSHPGRFVHFGPGATRAEVILKPNEYGDVDLKQRAAIVKLHGAVTREETCEHDHYVITEDHYIDYLAHTEVANLLPAPILQRLRNSHFLFLGYGMRDWNLRVILHRIWGSRKLDYPSWSIQLDPDELEKKFWDDRDVTILDVDLESYVEMLRTELDTRCR